MITLKTNEEARAERIARGKTIYERDIRPNLTPQEDGYYVVIDTESGQWETDRDDGIAITRLRTRTGSKSPLYLTRVGWRAYAYQGQGPVK